MGLMNNRAICPNCGGKIHTQASGVGHLTWMRSGPLVQTGSECQHCGVALSGKVGLNNVAILAEVEEAKQEARDERRQERQAHRAEVKAGRADLDTQLLDALRSGPVTVDVLAARFGVSKNDIRRAVVRQATSIKSKGHRSKETLSLR